MCVPNASPTLRTIIMYNEQLEIVLTAAEMHPCVPTKKWDIGRLQFLLDETPLYGWDGDKSLYPEPSFLHTVSS